MPQSTIIQSCTGLNQYNLFLVYCPELAPGTVSLTGDRAQGNNSEHDSHYTQQRITVSPMFTVVALGPVTC